MFYFIIIICLFGTFASEHMQIFPKINSIKKKKIATGYVNALKILLINRGFSSIYLIAIAYYIEKDAKINQLLIIFIITFVFLSILNFFTFRKIQKNREINKKILIINIFATLCNYLGITIPFLLSSIYPDYRMTLSYTGVIFNTFYTIINTLIIENKLAKTIDTSYNKAVNIGSSIILARSFASTINILILCLIYYLNGKF